MISKQCNHSPQNTSKVAPSPFRGPTQLPEQAWKKLKQDGFSEGLANALVLNKQAFARRIWIVDNSSSMNTKDGHCIISASPRQVAFRDCSRWEEIQETVIYHMQLAETIQAPTEFRFLNKPSHFGAPERLSIALDSSSFNASAAGALVRAISPAGCTPLTQHIDEIHQEVASMESDLRASGQRVAIVIATDGLPTDSSGHNLTRTRQAFVNSLRRLEGLPVWLVIRLCTDDDQVVDFYNELDNVLELSVDVLDDFTAEAKEVHAFNPWLNYGLPLHRMREMGFHDRLFDLIDQSKLSRNDVRDVCALIFGDIKFDGVPDPAVDWTGFITSINRLIETEEEQWNPIKTRPKPWLSVKKLNQSYGRRGWF